MEISTKEKGKELPQGKPQSRKTVHWPDPYPPKFSRPFVDDVSRLNATQIQRNFDPLTVEDLKQIVKIASETGVQISLRGTKHTMGGHTIVPNGFVVDMSQFKKISYNPETQLVTTETGAQWTDLIQFLNQFGLSPRTMQSYSSFSVGGTLSVNAHGITTDFSLAESVVSMKIIAADGKDYNCQRDSKNETERDLFRLAIGGYGLFGIIYEVTMKVNLNTQLHLEVLNLTPKEFPALYENVLLSGVEDGGDVDIKLARLDITSCENIELYILRRTSNTKTISSLPLEPRKMSLISRLIYKWLAPTLQEVRFTIERASGNAFDWSESGDRNVMMFESAMPLAKIYSPLFQIDDTFILQEYFVPKKSFSRWLDLSKPLYQSLNHGNKLISLLNTTIRFVYCDNDTFLPYSKSPDGVYAFVLYYRIRRTQEADQELAKFHNEFVNLTLKLGGTFYLPYRHHYSLEQLENAYGKQNLMDFMRMKEKYDPKCVFSSLWMRKYMGKYVGEEYFKRMMREAPCGTGFLEGKKGLESWKVPVVSEKRTDSYKKLFNKSSDRRYFLEQFLTRVFKVEDPNFLYRMISKALWHPSVKTDTDMYVTLTRELEKNNGAIHSLSKTWNSIKQLSDQKKELVSETMSILTRLGKLGQIHDYASIGDNGRLVLPLQEALDMRGQIWILHNTDPKIIEIPVILERGSVEPFGKFVSINYEEFSVSWDVPNESCDLVTMEQGLHHLPQDQIMGFLKEVVRILRPGGLFMVREHDARPILEKEVGWTSESDLIPMLDVAHSVFNVVTGVSAEEEAAERRGFRSVVAWREIIEQSGLVDTLLYEKQVDDPTLCIMMCFYKPPFTEYGPRVDLEDKELTQTSVVPPVIPIATKILKNIPDAVMDMMSGTVEKLIENIPALSEALMKAIGSNLSSGVTMVLSQSIKSLTSELVTWLQRFKPFFESSENSNNSLDFIPSEIFLLISALEKKAKSGKASPMELIAAALLFDIQKAFSVRSEDKDTRAKAMKEEKQHEILYKFSEMDVKKKMEELLKAVPEMKDVEILEKMETPAVAARFLKTFWAVPENEYDNISQKPSKLDPIAKWLTKKLDTQAWKDLCSAFDAIIKAKAVPPTLKSIINAAATGNNNNSQAVLWGKAMSALLSSPHVYFTAGMVFQAKLLGMEDIYEAWKKAQKERESKHPLETDSPQLLSALKAFHEPPMKIVKITSEEQMEDIKNVAEVVSATYGYTSLTTSPSDCTKLISGYLKGQTLYLSGVTFDSLQQIRSVFDGARRALVQRTSELVIQYRPVLELDSNYQSHIDELLHRLSESGIVKPLHKNDGHLTWFKLPEWMQVEFVQIFGASMSHTPWYRFPFTDFLMLYFKTLYQEISIVKSEHGFVKALFSNAFFVDLIPGVVMALLMGQLQLLALPVKAYSGAEYKNVELMVEQLVVMTPASETIQWKLVDKHIQNSVRVSPTHGVYVLTVPTFKPLTEAIKSIAVKVPTAQILEISNQKEIQVKVSLPIVKTVEEEENLLGKLKMVNGCEVMFTFRYPVDGTPNKKTALCVSLKVGALSLIKMIQTCASLGIDITQIYDFFT